MIFARCVSYTFQHGCISNCEMGNIQCFVGWSATTLGNNMHQLYSNQSLVLKQEVWVL